MKKILILGLLILFSCNNLSKIEQAIKDEETLEYFMIKKIAGLPDGDLDIKFIKIEEIGKDTIKATYSDMNLLLKRRQEITHYYVFDKDKPKIIKTSIDGNSWGPSIDNYQSTINTDQAKMDSIISSGNAKPKVVKHTADDSIEINKLKPFFSFKSDKFSGKTWCEPKNYPSYRNMNGMCCYFQIEDNKATNFRFLYQYNADDWLFIQRLQFLIDDKQFEYTPRKVDSDNGVGGIWEWFDENIEAESDINLIEALANSKHAEIKLIGEHYTKERTVSQEQISSIKRTLSLYRLME
jgi:hypothetical protein